MAEAKYKKTETQTTAAQPAEVTQQNYTPVQSYAETNNDYWLDQVEKEQQSNAVNPERHTAYTDEEMNEKYAQAGVDPTGQYVNPSRNMNSADPGYQSTVNREAAPDTSGGDEYWLSDAELGYVQYCKKNYNDCKTNGDAAGMTYWHNEAEKVRARYDYSGGTDGSMFLSTMQKSNGNGDFAGTGSASGDRYSDASGGSDAFGGSVGTGSGSDLKSYLDAWQQAALRQSNGQIDYGVSQAVAELQRALEDAQSQYREQAESVDRNARQAMDNSALYAQMRGDKGGIGQEQYNSIQNAAAQNHLAVQQAQTRLATDTQRQIADLRAQGEFGKADAALELTQSYLAQLIDLEKWAAEYDLSVEQFNAGLRQWEAEYQLALEKLQISQNQWQREFDYNKQRDTQNRLSGIGEALLSAGIPLTAGQMEAMGLTQEQADRFLAKSEQSSAPSRKDGDGGDVIMDYDGLFAAAEESGHPKSFIANNHKKYGFTSNTGLYDDYRDWAALQKELSEARGISEASIIQLGAGPLSRDEVIDMIIAGMLETESRGNITIVRWADGWDAGRYRRGENHSDPLYGVFP